MFDRIKAAINLPALLSRRSMTSRSLGFSAPSVSSSGALVTPENILTVSAVYQAVYVLSSGVASVDFNVVKYLRQVGRSLIAVTHINI